MEMNNFDRAFAVFLTIVVMAFVVLVVVGWLAVLIATPFWTIVLTIAAVFGFKKVYPAVCRWMESV